MRSVAHDATPAVAVVRAQFVTPKSVGGVLVPGVPVPDITWAIAATVATRTITINKLSFFILVP